jgi:hypothetical protein
LLIESKTRQQTAVVSHISRKTSEMWGTRRPVTGREKHDSTVRVSR